MNDKAFTKLMLWLIVMQLTLLNIGVSMLVKAIP